MITAHIQKLISVVKQRLIAFWLTTLMSLRNGAVIIALTHRVVSELKQEAIGLFFTTVMPLVTQLYHSYFIYAVIIQLCQL